MAIEITTVESCGGCGNFIQPGELGVERDAQGIYVCVTCANMVREENEPERALAYSNDADTFWCRECGGYRAAHSEEFSVYTTVIYFPTEIEPMLDEIAPCAVCSKTIWSRAMWPIPALFVRETHEQTTTLMGGSGNTIRLTSRTWESYAVLQNMAEKGHLAIAKHINVAVADALEQMLIDYNDVTEFTAAPHDDEDVVLITACVGYRIAYALPGSGSSILALYMSPFGDVTLCGHDLTMREEAQVTIPRHMVGDVMRAIRNRM